MEAINSNNIHPIIQDSLYWLKENEIKWKLDTPINKREYLQEIIKKMADKEEKKVVKEQLNHLSDQDLEHITNTVKEEK